MLGIGGASTTLASWTPRPAVERALDLGTGCGVQALHLGGARRSTSPSPTSPQRALDFARFNAELNGLDWEVVEGSMLDPVAGQRFGLIVSNPPFVITPRTPDVPLFEYRDGGQSGDASSPTSCARSATTSSPAESPSSSATGRSSATADWRERVRGWVTGTGLDAWIVQRDVQDPARVRRDLVARRRSPQRAPPSSRRCMPRGSTTSRRAA